MHILLNWLGQGALVALAAAAVLRVVPRSRTQARYWLCWAACLAVVALPALTYVGTGTSLAPVLPGPDIVAERSLISIPSAWWTSSSVVLALCVAWSCAYALRLTAAVAALRAARRECRECPAEVQARLECWSRIKATGRATRLVISSRVRCAGVLGGGAPLIALAPGLVDALDDDDLDRVVTHEWAHVQRHDDVAQFVQRIVLFAAGWHPAVRWLQRQLELEREVACDEIAVAATGSPKRYAACLATVAALPIPRVSEIPVLAVSASGLRQRIVRILEIGPAAAARPWRAITLCGSSALAVVAVTVASLQVAQAATPIGQLPAVAAYESSAAVATPASSVAAPTPIDKTDRVRDRGRATKASAASWSASAAPVSASPAVAQSQPPSGATDPPPVPVSIPLVPLTAAFDLGASPHVPERAAQTPPPAAKQPAPVWAPVADAGVAMGRGSQTVGVATAGFFTRLGKKVARSF